MVKGKIISYLQSLSESEFENLEHFLNSPIFIKSKTAKAFYSFVKKKRKKDKISEFTWKDISDFVYKNEKYNENRVMKLVSDFCKILERYFEFLIFEEDEKFRKNTLLQSLRKRNLKKYLLKEFKEIDLKNLNITAEDCYYAYSNYLEMAVSTGKIDIKIMEEKFNDIVVFVRTEHMIAKSIYKSKVLIDNENETLAYLKKNENRLLKEFPALYYRYRIYKMLNEETPLKFFYEIKKFIEKNEKKLAKEVLNYFYDKLLYISNKNKNYNIYKRREDSINSKIH